MQYLLDTDTLSYIMKKRSPFHTKVLNKLLNVSPADVYISSITVAEITLGIYKLPPNQRYNLRQIILGFTQNMNILEFDINAAWLYGMVRAGLQNNGTDIGIADTQIAAHALSNQLVLVTNNVRHFDRVDSLKLDNWTI